MAINQPPKQAPKKNPLGNNAGLKYTAMGTQMFVIIGAAAWAGVSIDKHFNHKFPLAALSLTLLGVAVALWLSIKDFIKKK
jgi:hypothetical protein